MLRSAKNMTYQKEDADSPPGLSASTFWHYQKEDILTQGLVKDARMMRSRRQGFRSVQSVENPRSRIDSAEVAAPIRGALFFILIQT